MCFVEESCEALLSRMGHRCDVYRTLHGFDNTFDLFMTLPPPKRGFKSTRGKLKLGLVAEFASRIRRIVFGGGDFCFAAPGGGRDMHVVLQKEFPDNYVFPAEFPQTMPIGMLEYILRRCLRCLTGKTTLRDDVIKLMNDNVPLRASHEFQVNLKVIEDQEAWFKAQRRLAKPAARNIQPQVPRAPTAAPPPRRLLPKPRGVPFQISHVKERFLKFIRICE